MKGKSNTAPHTGDHLDAEALYRAHAEFVARFLLRLGAHGQDVPDLVQEVFLVAHRRGGFTVGRAKPTTWLAEISFRVFSDRRKKSRRKLEDADSETVTVAPSHASSPSERAEKRQALERVQSALDALTPEKRTVFILYELEGESCDAIATGLGIPVGTVYSRLHSARRDFTRAHERLADETPSASPAPGAVAGARA
ncbi:RNA polymerase sigma factor [Paraliomyxa miuraensis]|uniref:RNA polymerase sigma factor n=1 Tax=Paraliomyxa miuraensis TaxID=376150 RepID=UPI0022520252|nr:RNA polymerase sigma factor [Paraliomyxa miuraensis]MCX4242666.1 RNA polymerase sigma factor [Paraliomyxa miuraensis]